MAEEKQNFDKMVFDQISAGLEERDGGDRRKKDDPSNPYSQPEKDRRVNPDRRAKAS